REVDAVEAPAVRFRRHQLLRDLPVHGAEEAGVEVAPRVGRRVQRQVVGTDRPLELPVLRDQARLEIEGRARGVDLERGDRPVRAGARGLDILVPILLRAQDELAAGRTRIDDAERERAHWWMGARCRSRGPGSPTSFQTVHADFPHTAYGW